MKKLLWPENFNVCKIYYKMKLKVLNGIYLEPSMGTVMFVSYIKIVEASNNLSKKWNYFCRTSSLPKRITIGSIFKVSRLRITTKI